MTLNGINTGGRQASQKNLAIGVTAVKAGSLSKFCEEKNGLG
jgi:hypothetical protein